jgi:chromosome segregation ATPase
MNRFLSYFNLAGVAALGVLCVFQWQMNRKANLEEIVLQKSEQALKAKVAEQGKTIDGLTADLNSFRDQLAKASTNWKDGDAKLRALERENMAVTTERDGLKESISTWTNAVALRDARIQEANATITKVAAERDGIADKYNALATKHNGVVKDLNDAIAQLNAARAALSTNSVAAKK